MTAFPKKVEDRLVQGLKRFQPIISSARARDVNESDTVVIVTDLLSELFGYDKYSEITTEHNIRGTFCDLAIKIEGKVQLLLEIKAIGLDLKESHVKQAVDYASNLGVEWVVLTNGIAWQVFRVAFTKPINKELVLEFDILNINPKNESEFECLFLLTKEGLLKSMLSDYHTHMKAINRFSMGAIVLSDPVLAVIRREIKRLSPGIKIETSQVKSALMAEVLKREVVEGEKADEARKKVHKVLGKLLKSKKAEDGEDLAPDQVNTDDQELTCTPSDPEDITGD